MIFTMDEEQKRHDQKLLQNNHNLLQRTLDMRNQSPLSSTNQDSASDNDEDVGGQRVDGQDRQLMELHPEAVRLFQDYRDGDRCWVRFPEHDRQLAYHLTVLAHYKGEKRLFDQLLADYRSKLTWKNSLSMAMSARHYLTRYPEVKWLIQKELKDFEAAFFEKVNVYFPTNDGGLCRLSFADGCLTRFPGVLDRSGAKKLVVWNDRLVIFNGLRRPLTALHLTCCRAQLMADIPPLIEPPRSSSAVTDDSLEVAKLITGDSLEVAKRHDDLIAATLRFCCHEGRLYAFMGAHGQVYDGNHVTSSGWAALPTPSVPYWIEDTMPVSCPDGIRLFPTSWKSFPWYAPHTSYCWSALYSTATESWSDTHQSKVLEAVYHDDYLRGIFSFQDMLLVVTFNGVCRLYQYPEDWTASGRPTEWHLLQESESGWKVCGCSRQGDGNLVVFVIMKGNRVNIKIVDLDLLAEYRRGSGKFEGQCPVYVRQDYTNEGSKDNLARLVVVARLS